VAKYIIGGAHSSYKAMYDIVEQAKEGTILTPDEQNGIHIICLAE